MSLKLTILNQRASGFYRICTRCIMDTSDPLINFGSDGRCTYCHNFDSLIKSKWQFGMMDDANLRLMVDDIRKAGKGKDFDCIIGLSGGLDSSYVAYVAREMMGLRPLLFHVDAG